MTTADTTTTQRKETKYPRLLPDRPSEDDKLGSHKRIAQAIAGLIRDDEEGGKAIALTGDWGSGKSTVVRMLQRRLDKEPEGKLDARVFVFDAWAHQDDTLRRSFLEELTRFLGRRVENEKEWLYYREWSERLSETCRPKDKSRVDVAPSLGLAGTLVAISLLLLPLGVSLVLGSVGNNANFGKGVMWLGIGLLVLPVAIGVVTAFLQWCSSSNAGDSEGSQDPKPSANPFALLLKLAPQIQAAQTVRTPEPTSVEFKRFFLQVLQRCLKDEPNRRLIIAIDNLDRMDAEDALTLWGAMRTFIDPENPERKEWLSRLWVIVAIDDRAMRRLWEPETKEESECADNPAQPGNESNAIGKTTSAFMDKTFQVKFSVREPVLAKWKQYFKDQLAQAFNGCLKDPVPDQLYLLYAARCAEEDLVPTPRNIKLFVNQLVAQRRLCSWQWDAEPPVILPAIYVLYQEKIRRPSQDILGKPVIGSVARTMLERVDWPTISPSTAERTYDWKEHLTSLHYGVPVKQAIHMLYELEVFSMMNEGQQRELAERLQNVPHIEEVVESVLETSERVWITEMPSALARLAETLFGTGLYKESAWQPIWACLIESIRTVETWDRIDADVGRGIISTLEHYSPDDFRRYGRQIWQSLAQTRLPPAKGFDDADVTEKIKDWLKGIRLLINHFEHRHQEGFIRQHFKVNGEPMAYVMLLQAIAQSDVHEDQWVYFSPESKPTEIVQQIVNLLMADSNLGSVVTLLPVMSKIEVNWKYDDLARPLGQRIGSSNSPRMDQQATEALLWLACHEKSEAARAQLEGNTARGKMPKLVEEALRQKDVEAAASFSLALLILFSSGEVRSSASFSGQFESLLKKPDNYGEVLEALAESILKNGCSDALREVLPASAKAKNLITKILELSGSTEDKSA